MTKPKYPPELRERAILKVYEQREQHESQWLAISSVAEKMGCNAQTLNNLIHMNEAKTRPDAPL